MATPDYLQQVIVSGRRDGERRAFGSRAKARWRPSVTSLVWASLDIVTVFLAWVVAARLRLDVPSDLRLLRVLPYIFHHSPHVAPLYVGWFAVCAVFFMRSYGALHATAVQKRPARATHDGPVHVYRGPDPLRHAVCVTQSCGLAAGRVHAGGDQYIAALHPARGLAAHRVSTVSRGN